MRFLPLSLYRPQQTRPPPPHPNLVSVCVWERERARDGEEGGVHSYRHVSPQRGDSTKDKSISAGQRPPSRLGDRSNPRILMQQPLKRALDCGESPHILSFCAPHPNLTTFNPHRGFPSNFKTSTSLRESLAASSSQTSAWATEGPAGRRGQL